MSDFSQLPVLSQKSFIKDCHTEYIASLHLYFWKCLSFHQTKWTCNQHILFSNYKQCNDNVSLTSRWFLDQKSFTAWESRVSFLCIPCISSLLQVLICVFGADPNKSNVRNGRTSLHYATQYNHVNVVAYVNSQWSQTAKVKVLALDWFRCVLLVQCNYQYWLLVTFLQSNG